MDGDVSKGSIHVIIENKNKETILDLTPEIKTGMLTVDEKCRYYLMLKFEKADGVYEEHICRPLRQRDHCSCNEQ